jgi:phage shock protein C
MHSRPNDVTLPASRTRRPIVSPATKLARSTTDRVIAGVCAGLAEYFGWSATRVRVGYVILSIISAAFPGLLVYLVLWFMIPERRDAG